MTNKPYIPSYKELISKDCPFCDAGKPNIFKIGNKWYLECKNMGCIFERTIGHEDLDYLLELWNGRNYDK